ncbi:fimbrial biogenesis outer membrane usher protein [Paraburkholderia sediminicola]|nr:fimbrial biogenesis outer membrane usher protein [Paraburkholderia sediminicola]
MCSNRLPSSFSSFPRLKPQCAMVLSALSVWQMDTHASRTSAQPDEGVQVAQVEFDRSLLRLDSSQAVDLSRFAKGNVVLPGIYDVDLYANGDWIGRADVPFRQMRDSLKNTDAQACFDRNLLERMGVNLTKLTPEVTTTLAVPENCLPIREIIDEATSTFDFGNQRLDVGIQQVSMNRAARGYVSPESWDNGVTAGFLSYDANLYRYDSHGNGQSSTQTQGYVGLIGGFNAGPWHFRHSGSYNWSSPGGQQYQTIATYVQRDLPGWASQLTIGEGYTTGELFSSTGFRGVSLATDDRMLPDSLRGYAPTVRGVATSNAKVTIRQNGAIIRETTVAPGAFEFDDLSANGYGGDLDVSVTEADGSVHRFAVAYAAVPLSLRPGVNRYSVTAGTVHNSQVSGDPGFVQATWQHGFTNLFTGYAGIIAATGYGAAMAGGAFTTPLGAFGADYTQARTGLPGQGHATGGSARISYSQTLPQSGSNIAIAAYRYSTGGYFDLNTAMAARSLTGQSLQVNAVPRQRNSEQISLGQRLGEKGGQMALAASVVNYWNRSGSDINFSAGYSKTHRNIGYTLQATRQRGTNGATGTLYYAGVTIPLGSSRPVTLTANLTHSSNGQTQMQSTVSGAWDENGQLYYGITANRASGGGTTQTLGGGANVSYHAPYADLFATVGAGAGYSQGSLGMRGAVVMHPGGITLSQPLQETFGIVEAPQAEGARLVNASGVRVDSRGYAVIPYLTPYRMNSISLDPHGLSTDVELLVTGQQVAPHAGSVVFVKFPTVYGRSAIIQARQANGKPLPFGAAVLDDSSKEIGVVGQGSRIFARGLQDKGGLTVKWSEDGPSQCHISYDLPVRIKGASGFQNVDAACTAQGEPQPSYGPNTIGPSAVAQ